MLPRCKNPEFRALYLATQKNSVFSFNKYRYENIIFIFGCWLLPENNGFTRVRGATAHRPLGSYAYATFWFMPTQSLSQSLPALKAVSVFCYYLSHMPIFTSEYELASQMFGFQMAISQKGKQVGTPY